MNSECLENRLCASKIWAVAIATGVSIWLVGCSGKSTDSKFQALRTRAAQAATAGDNSKASDLYLEELTQGESYGSNDVRLPTALNDLAEFDEKSGHSEKCPSLFERAMGLCQDHLSLAKNPHLQIHSDDDRAWAKEGIRSCFGSMRTNIGLGFYGNAKDEYNDAKAYCALIGDTTTAAELDRTCQKLHDYDTSANAAFDDAVDGKRDPAFTNSGVRSSIGAEFHKLGHRAITDPGNMHENEWLALLSEADKNIGTRDNEYRDIFRHLIENYLRFGMLDKADDLLEKDIKVYQYLDKLNPLSEEASPEDTLFCAFACIDYQFLGEIQLRRHKYKEAIPWFERALFLTARYRLQRKETCEAHEGLGIAYREIGQDSSSVGEFRKAVNTFIPKDDNAGRLVEFKANLEKAEKKVGLNSSEPTPENASSASAQPVAK
ncbi:MAG TPA: tetratricopeptide repeat protein [Trichormus sp.]